MCEAKLVKDVRVYFAQISKDHRRLASVFPDVADNRARPEEVIRSLWSQTRVRNGWDVDFWVTASVRLTEGHDYETT